MLEYHSFKDSYLKISDENARMAPEFPISCFIVAKKVNSLLSFKILKAFLNMKSDTARFRLESENSNIHYSFTYCNTHS